MVRAMQRRESAQARWRCRGVLPLTVRPGVAECHYSDQPLLGGTADSTAMTRGGGSVLTQGSGALPHLHHLAAHEVAARPSGPAASATTLYRDRPSTSAGLFPNRHHASLSSPASARRGFWTLIRGATAAHLLRTQDKRLDGSPKRWRVIGQITQTSLISWFEDVGIQDVLLVRVEKSVAWGLYQDFDRRTSRAERVCHHDGRSSPFVFV